MKALKALGWFILPFIMLPLQWRRLKGTGRVIGSAWVVLFIIIGIAGNGGNSDSSKPVTANVDTASKPKVQTVKTQSKPNKPAVKQTPEQKLIADVKAAYASKNGVFEKVEVNSYLGEDTAYKGGYIVDIHQNADDGYNTNQSVQWTLMDMKDVSQKIFQDNKKVEEVAFWVDANLTDNYGNQSHGLWFRVALSGNDGYKINWANILQDQFNQFLAWQVGTQDAHKAFLSVVNSGN